MKIGSIEACCKELEFFFIVHQNCQMFQMPCLPFYAYCFLVYFVFYGCVYFQLGLFEKCHHFLKPLESER